MEGLAYPGGRSQERGSWSTSVDVEGAAPLAGRRSAEAAPRKVSLGALAIASPRPPGAANVDLVGGWGVLDP